MFALFSAVAKGDIGDNSCFWKPATVIESYLNTDLAELADVIFDSTPEAISHGHFVTMFKPLLNSQQAESLRARTAESRNASSREEESANI